MKKLTTRGFTLIELLVVIAIIGILSSIVLASLSSARDKGTDTAIKATLSSMRAQAELYSSTWNNYGPVMTEATCPSATGPATIFASSTTGGLWPLISGLNDKAGNSATRCSVETGGTAWAVSATLKESGKAACVDSAGTSRVFTGTADAAIVGSVCQ